MTLRLDASDIKVLDMFALLYSNKRLDIVRPKSWVLGVRGLLFDFLLKIRDLSSMMEFPLLY